ncbi:ABC transporter substrate-binding protein [Streptomyces xiamenensis]
MNSTLILRCTGAVLVSALALSACSGDGERAITEGDLIIDGELIAAAEVYEQAQTEGTLVFYTGGSEQSEAAIVDRFTEATGIKAEIVRLAPNRLTERVLSETAAGQLGADVIRISGEDLTLSIAEAGAFAPHELPREIGAAVGDAVREGGTYINSFDRVYSFAYNNTVVDEAEAPRNWADLIDGRWKDKTAITQVGAGGSTAALTRFQLDVLGEDWLRGYAATSPRVFDSVAGMIDSLARGEILIGSVPIATAYGAIQQGAPLTVAVPDEGAAAYPFYVGVGSSTSRPNAGAVFVNWLMSADGQSAAAEMGDYPVRTDVPPPTIGDQQLPGLDDGFLHRSDMETALEHMESDADTWRRVFDYTG